MPVEDQEKYDASMPEKIIGTIKQPDNPNFEKPVIESITPLLINKKTLVVKWVVDKTHPPCSQYTITIKKLNDGIYDVLSVTDIYTPETNRWNFPNLSVGTYTITVKCYSILHTTAFKHIVKTFE